LPDAGSAAQNPAVTEDLDDVGHAALALAREAVERFVRAGVVATPPSGLPPPLGEPAGVFVTLRLDGQLRGCIGVLPPTEDATAREIVSCAIAAAARDPRFRPVRPEELARLEYEVDLVGALEPAAGLDDLDPQVYGVVVESDGHRGVLLPGLEGVEDAAHQVRIARAKAGLSPDAPVRLSRFQVRRFREPRA
jgi:AmmeMemoRadiSam system protein A